MKGRMNSRYSFPHLHLHTEYSLLDSPIKLDALFAFAEKNGVKYLATSNHGNCDDAVKLTKGCLGRDIHPIIGSELYIIHDGKEKEKGERKHLLVLVKEQKGFKNLMSMLTEGNINHFYYKPQVPLSFLYSHLDGLVVTSACSSGIVSWPDGKAVCENLKDLKGKDFYLEVQPFTERFFFPYFKKVLSLSKELEIPLVATNDVHYLYPDGEAVHQVLINIGAKRRFKDPNKREYTVKDLFYKSENQMEGSFRKQGLLSELQIREVLTSAHVIAERCEFVLEPVEPSLPISPGARKEKDHQKYFEQLCWEGLKKRRLSGPKYTQRLKHEINQIIRSKRKFADYFLIVQDFQRWAKEKARIMTSPCRGSAGGSLAAYALGITEVDPLKYGLIFERFVSPGRIDYPDIDLDFEDSRREEVHDYLRQAYGESNVAHVSTFGKMKAKGALRDVSRYFDVPLADVNLAAKSVLQRSGGDSRANFSLLDSTKTFERAKTFAAKYPGVTEIAIALEGNLRNLGVHAAGIVLSSEDLKKSGRCYLRQTLKGLAVNWDDEDLEYMGFVKFDILGLSTLSLLADVKKEIIGKARRDFSFYNLKLDDRKVFKSLSNGDTVGIFQLGSLGIQKMIRELGVESFGDIVAMNALYRPGALRTSIVDDFISRKHGQQKTKKINSVFDKLTKDTHGLVIYQEQVMYLLNEMAGLPWRTADTVRKVMGKSEGTEKFMSFQKEFADGCAKRGTMGRKEAERMFGELKNFGCLTGDTIIYRVSSNQYKGREVSLKDVYEGFRLSNSNYRFRGLKVLSLHADNQIRYNTIKAVYQTGAKEVFYIRTAGNKTIRATADHRFIINGKWMQVNQANPGDRIRVSDLRLARKIYGQGYGSGPHGQRTPRLKKGRGKTNDQRRRREELIRRYKGRCQICGSNRYVEMHHINGDQSDNSEENTMLLCRKGHRAQTDRRLFARFRKGYYVQEEIILEIKSVGKRETYDVEMEEKPANFVANHFISHNSYGFNKSHSVGYSMLAYYGAWCKTYYPLEFFTALMNHSSEDEIEEYVEDCRKRRMKVKLPSIQLSDGAWTNDGKALICGLSSIKGLSQLTIGKILKAKPFRSFSEFQSQIGKLSRREMEALLAADTFKPWKIDDILKQLNGESQAQLSFLSLGDKKDKFELSKVADDVLPFREKSDLSFHNRRLIAVLSENLKIEKIGNVDFGYPSKEYQFFCGKMRQIKYGYRDKIARRKGEIHGTVDSWGGVYGNFQDDTTFIMLVFGSDLYLRKKMMIETLEGEDILIKANHTWSKPNLYASNLWRLSDLRRGDFDDLEGLRLVKQRKLKYNGHLSSCQKCNLRASCHAPVPMGLGKSNLMIVGEAPGKEEDRQGRPFIGMAGQLLFRELKKLNFERGDFYISNTVKCYSREKPTLEQVEVCGEHLVDEIRAVSPIAILSLGNFARYFFTKEKSGIVDANADVEWNDEYQCWILYSVHPAMLLYQKGNERLLEESLNEFKNLVVHLL